MMNAIVRDLFKDQLTEIAKKRETKFKEEERSSRLGWTYLSNDFRTFKAVRTYNTLFTIQDSFDFFTPNTFYRKDKRRKTTLRWINAMSVDIDVKNGQNVGVTFPDIETKITELGIPMPSLVVRTPSNGLHLHWFFDQPKRSSRKLNKLFTLIQKKMSEQLGADLEALGPERYYRLPKANNTIFQSDIRPSFDDFCDWFTLAVEEEEEERKDYKKGFCTVGKHVLKHPAILKLLKGTQEGQRDATCFTLALAYKSAGYSSTEAESFLHDWNQKNDPPLPWVEICRKVKSAYSGSYHGPSSEAISRLSGIPFFYTRWEGAKERKDRVYSHSSEWEKDLLSFFKKHGGSISCSLRTLATKVKSSVDKNKTIPLTTLKRLLNSLQEQGKLLKEVTGTGRGSVTTFTVVAKKKAPAKQKDEVSKKRESKKPNKERVQFVKQLEAQGGWQGSPALDLDPSTSIPLEFYPPVGYLRSFTPAVPKDVPEHFVSRLTNLGFTGPFIFGLWSKVRLVFKQFSIPYRAISKTADYIRLAVEAIGFTVDKKGSPIRTDYQNDDSFNKYFYGTLKGLLTTYRTELLAHFVEYIEELSDIRLTALGAEIEQLLESTTANDVDLLQQQLREIESEQGARNRRKAYEKTFWNDSLFHDFRFVLKQDD